MTKEELKAMVKAVDESLDRDKHTHSGDYRGGWDECVNAMNRAIDALPEKPQWLDLPTNDTGWWWFLRDGQDKPTAIYIVALWYAEGYQLNLWEWKYLGTEKTEKGKRGRDYYYKDEWSVQSYTDKYKGKWQKVNYPRINAGASCFVEGLLSDTEELPSPQALGSGYTSPTEC